MSNDKTIISEEHLETIVKYLEDIRFGSVTIVVQDGKIVQIEKQEKIRFR